MTLAPFVPTAEVAKSNARSKLNWSKMLAKQSNETQEVAYGC
jgi:hypothetical protein